MRRIVNSNAFLIILSFVLINLNAQEAKPPIMGWSSWNHFRIKIDEKMIREQADAMISSGLYDAGYRFINIDDGYFGGRDSIGNLLIETKKFPSGMRDLTNYIHQKGLKTGIYTDAGRNTCAMIYDKDKNGFGSGIYGHEDGDLDLFFNQWNFDFLKVDWCGGRRMGLDEETAYMNLIHKTKKIDSNLIFNICRWQFPGTWAIKQADSWRISLDIYPKFSWILKIIELNAELHPYASAGHYNDMDMLEVGNGMSYDEDKSHFSMWCIMNSPLLAGNDLRKMSKETIEILTNQELIALNQDEGFKQAKRIVRGNDIDIWLKPLGKEGNKYAIAILNKSKKTVKYHLDAKVIGIDQTTLLRDLWLHKDIGNIENNNTFVIPKHGIVVLKTL